MQTRPLHIILCAALIYSCMSCGSYRLQSVYRNTLLINQHLIVNDTIRTYHLFNPHKKANSPIIFLFHGNGGSADNIAGLSNIKAPYIPWFDIASKEDLILVIPDGMMGPKNSKGWNDCRNDASRIPNSDDVGFIKNLLDTLHNSLNYDLHKVYMVGTSNGGHFVMRLAQEIPHRMTAFASIVASGPAYSKCTNSTIPVSALFMNGTKDPLVPYMGGNTENGSVISTDSCIAYWINRNGTQNSPIITQFQQMSSSKVIAYRYPQGIHDTEVMLYKVEGGGHIEPSQREHYSFIWTAFAGTQNGDIESADEIWSFFKNKIRK